MKSVSKARARKLANWLLKENRRNGRSWRDIAGDFPPSDEGKCIVKAGTLNRIANSKGAWLPKDDAILKLLGLLTTRSPYAILPRWWERTPESLRLFRYIRNQTQVLSNETRIAQRSYRGRKNQ